MEKQEASEATQVSEAFCCAPTHPGDEIASPEPAPSASNEPEPDPCQDGPTTCSSELDQSSQRTCDEPDRSGCIEPSQNTVASKAAAETPKPDPRRRRRQLLQQRRRMAEQKARMAAVRYIEQARRRGIRKKQAAASLGISARTVRLWKQESQDSVAIKPRGRPPLTCDVSKRNQVIRFLHQVTGPSIGLPALQALFPEVPRCILEDLLGRYVRMWRRRYRKRGFRLTWHGPGRVWAIDFSEAPYPIDGVYPYLLAVRDLASHRQLAWQPVKTQTAKETVPLLRQLFARHGPPLVLKSDNGSAFIAHLTQEAMLEAAVAQLFSPPRRPQYNGALERSNGTLKTYTDQHAIHEGHPFRWTCEDLEHARQLANTISRPWGHRGRTPDEAWNQRAPISEAERETFQLALEKHRTKASEDLGLDPSTELTVANRARLDRLALSRTLEELCYLTKNRVTRAPKKPKRKSREELTRRAAELADDAAPAGNTPAKPAPTTRRKTQSRHKRRRSPARRAENSTNKVLALPSGSATMPIVVDAISGSTSSSNQHPTHTSTQGGWTFYSWLRRPIALLLSLAKAAKIMR